MITYNNLVTAFNNFADNHFILRSFSHGGADDADLAKIENYPLLHLVYAGSSYDEGVKNISLDVYILGQPSDKLDKTDYQKEVISDLEQIAEDLLADVNLGGNVFQLEYNYDLEIATVTPLEEEESNTLSGVLLNLTLSIPWLSDSCNLPLTGVTPTSGTCEDATVINGVSYTQAIASGSTFTLPNITLTEVDGSTVSSPSVVDLTCSWFDIIIKDQLGDKIGTITSYPVGGSFEVTCPSGGGTATVENSDDSYSDTVDAGNTLVLPDITVTDSDGSTSTVPSVQDVVCTQVSMYPFLISHRKPSYTTGNTGDYPTLFAAGYFDILFPSTPIQMVQLGADNFTLSVNNKFGNTSRYTSTDGTESDAGTARFSSYGSGVSNIVIDHYRGVMWYNLPLGGSSTTWGNAQGEIDAINTASLGGFTNWIRPTRDLLTLSAVPDNNQDVHDSPNLIEDTGTRRYITCEKLPYLNQGFQVFHSNGGESTQTTTTTAGGQNRVVACRLMSLTELFG